MTTPNNEQRTTGSDFFADQLMAALPSTPSLTAAFQAQDRSATVGFDFANIELVMGKVLEEMREVEAAFQERDKDPGHFAEEIGDCFFVLVNLCRHAKLDPEALVRENARKYLARCQFIEAKLRASNENWNSVPLQEIYRMWKEAKKSGL